MMIGIIDFIEKLNEGIYTIYQNSPIFQTLALRTRVGGAVRASALNNPCNYELLGSLS